MFGFTAIAKKIFGTTNQRIVRKHQKSVDAINALEKEYEALSDADLRQKTQEFRERHAKGETLDNLLVEAFAVVREASKRTLKQRHFDVQLIGGIVLHQGQIAEMKTGEGKTLVATLAAYLNAIPGKGVHVVTVNDYLARRDASWMGQIYKFLGLSVGVIVPGLQNAQRKEAYACDVTYATNNELGFDYLRDNLALSREGMVQRSFSYAIVDEVDSILIDEARTPLIISGPTEDKTDLYVGIDRLVKGLSPDDYKKDEKQKAITLTEEGTEKIEQLLNKAQLLKTSNLYDWENTEIVHHVNVALRAQFMFQRDTDYIVKDNKIVIIDEFTGRMMEGRRYSEGLHQGLEAKEGVAVQAENQTVASITFQNYFRMYPKIAGMTGTAATEAAEFLDIYNLPAVEIPTNVAVVRKDEHDEFYRTENEKFTAIVKEIGERHKLGQPILVGTVSIEKSEKLSALLKKNKIPHHVLNARYHEQEAYIVAQAGHSGAVTIATNMAGRGTDIQLGGHFDMRVQQESAGVEDGAAKEKIAERIRHEIAADREKVLAAGGLYVIGTERHESRRIDNQLRGRSGRQGDPGRSKFYLSLQDDLMRIFGPERMDSMLVKLGLEEGEAIIHPWINKAIEKAQEKVEARNYEVRKQLLKYDNVMNDQRKVIYEQRLEVMDAEDVGPTITSMRHETIRDVVAQHIPAKAFAEDWDLKGLDVAIKRLLNLALPLDVWVKEQDVEETEIVRRITEASDRQAENKKQEYGASVWKTVEKTILLKKIDEDWRDHLSSLDHLRRVISLRAYGQRDPLNEYKAEAFAMFEALLNRVREGVTTVLSHIVLAVERGPLSVKPKPTALQAHHADPQTGEDEVTANSQSPREGSAVIRQPQKAFDPADPSSWGRVPRNLPCPCGSGKKYKHCHGAFA